MLTEEAVGLAVLGHMVAREALVHQGKALQVAARSVPPITTTVAVAAQARWGRRALAALLVVAVAEFLQISQELLLREAAAAAVVRMPHIRTEVSAAQVVAVMGVLLATQMGTLERQTREVEVAEPALMAAALTLGALAALA